MQPAVQPPQPAGAWGCVNCGQVGTLRSHQKDLTQKKRVKFGIFWVLISLISLGIGFIVWLIMPRRNEVVGVDRYNECTNCRTRQ